MSSPAHNYPLVKFWLEGWEDKAWTVTDRVVQGFHTNPPLNFTITSKQINDRMLEV